MLVSSTGVNSQSSGVWRKRLYNYLAKKPWRFNAWRLLFYWQEPRRFGVRADATLVILFFENLDNVFRVDANGVGFAEEENDMKISWRAKLSWVIERVLCTVGQSNCERSKGLTLYEIFYLTKVH